MKNLLRYTIVLQMLVFIVPITSAQFQPAPVVKSQEKTVVNGKYFYIHTVQKGQTAYSISKAYEVTVEDIKNSNPEVDILHMPEGLAIRIPDARQRQAAVYPENRNDFIAHVVRRKDTVYSLAKKYNVDVELIYQYNPWAREGIRQDQTIWIPKKKEMQKTTAQPQTTDNYFYYTVKDKDTLYSIARIYGVNVSDIIENNPALREGLKAGQVLKVPKNITPESPTVFVDSLLSIPCNPPDQHTVFNVALMLPLFATYNMEIETAATDTLAEEGTYVPQQRQQGLRGRNFAEFYEGFMLALDSLKKTGLSVNVHVFDTERDTNKVKKIIRELNVVQPDLIIGPVYSDDVKITARFAANRGILLVSPLSTRSSLAKVNPSIIQIVPSNQYDSYAMGNFFRQFKKGRVILLRGSDSLSMKNSWRFKNYLRENMPVDESGNPLYFKDYRLSDSLRNNLGKILAKDMENLVVVFSDKEADVSLLVTRLIQMPSYPVILYGMPSWQSFTNIDLPFFHSLQIHLISPFFTDYTNPAVKKFLHKSRSVYGYEPYEVGPLGYNFSMLGYDIGMTFLTGLKQFGRNFQSCINDIQVNQLLTDFNFIREGNGGYVNNSFNMIEYKKDFTIELQSVIPGAPVFPVAPLPLNSTVPGDSIPLILPAQ